MPCSISLRPTDYNALLRYYRRDPDPQVRFRAHLLLLLAAGYPWNTIAAVLFTSSSTIARWRRRYRQGGVDAVFGRPLGRRRRLAGWWAAVVVGWVLRRSPRDFGLLRSRWSCAAVAVVLRAERGGAVSRETVRRWLHQEGLAWRRPRPVLGPADPDRAAKVQALRRLLADLPPDEVAVFQDEVDVNTNPDIGCMWMRRGEQAAVVTPGTNVKRLLAGSLNWRTGRLVVTEGAPGQGRDGALFVRHLDDLRRAYRRYRKVHVICDNAKAHACRRVAAYLGAWGHRVELHYLPRYAPECNPIERVWWHLHEEITRNHRCKDIEELLDLVFAWLEGRSPFAIETSIYAKQRAA
jgi:putative transposase